MNHVRVGGATDFFNSLLEEFRENTRTEKLLLDFIRNFRDSGMSREELLAIADASGNPYRMRSFFALAFPLLDRIQALFDEACVIDFADMLRRGAEGIRRAGKVFTYRIILVDEFQDTSRLRMELVETLAAHCVDDCILFFVGDDWQGINKFAGADTKYFQEYSPESAKVSQAHKTMDHHGFARDGKSSHLVWLAKTFRCPQGISDVARAIVSRAAGMMDKNVEAADPTYEGVIRIVRHPDSGDGRLAAARKELQRIAALPRPKSKDGTERLHEVFLLTRAMADGAVPDGFDSKSVKKLIAEFKGKLDIEHSTMHSTKGLEKDFVLVVGNDTGDRGFPNIWDEDPIIYLTRPKGDPFDEERRLFYVVLTRAKKQTILLAAANRPGKYVRELPSLRGLQDCLEWDGEELPSIICPRCDSGILRPIRDQSQVGCSTYPKCGFVDARAKYPHIAARADRQP